MNVPTSTSQPPNTAPFAGSSAEATRYWGIAGLALWLIPMVAISIIVGLHPDGRTVTPLYHEAVSAWHNRQPLYRGVAGMNYLPQFVLVFSPYHALGRVAGDIAWRLTAAAGLAAGLWLFCGTINFANRQRGFAIATIIVMPVCLPALANGQANAHLGAALLLAAWCLRTQRWGWAAALLWLTAGIKPLGFAAMGMAFAVYPTLWWRLALGAPVFFGVPFLIAPAHYVAGQFLAAAHNLQACSAVTENRFADFNGLLRSLGLALSSRASLVVRALAGVVFMAACWIWPRRSGEPRRALLWLSASASFLMLFNPMTEANSYVILAPAIGLMAGLEFERGNERLGWLFAAMGLTMGLLPEPLQHPFGNYFSLVWHPTMTLIFVGTLGWQMSREHRRTGEWSGSVAGDATHF